MTDDPRMHIFAATVVAVGHSDDCAFCGFKDRLARNVLDGAVDPDDNEPLDPMLLEQAERRWADRVRRAAVVTALAMLDEIEGLVCHGGHEYRDFASCPHARCSRARLIVATVREALAKRDVLIAELEDELYHAALAHHLKTCATFKLAVLPFSDCLSMRCRKWRALANRDANGNTLNTPAASMAYEARQ